MKSTSLELYGCLQKRQPFFFLLFILVFASCQKPQEEIHQDYEILFTVDDISRTVFDFESAYVDHLIKTGRNDTKQERYRYLNEMIDNILLANEASSLGYLDHSTYQGAIFFEQRKSMLDFYFIDEMGKILEPLTDEEVRLAYAKRQRKVYVRQLYSANPADLEGPYQQLLSGESFVDVANAFYETSSFDSLAGYIGPISYFGVEDAFAEAAYSTNLGEFTQPIRTNYGYHIIYVEYIEFPAMLTEDDYQYRKQGVSSQLRLRKQQLVSNDYVRTLMESLNVQANGENITALREIIQNLEGDAIINDSPNEETSIQNWTDDRIEQLASAFDKNAVLATYQKDGVEQAYTFQQYLDWLPYLSFQESKSRTGASVGRGLRNEVIYQLAAENNYQEDNRVQTSIEKRGLDVLSDLYQYDLAMEALMDTTSVAVPNSYRDRLINNRNLLLKAEYWTISAENLLEAETIKEDIDSGAPPISYDNYQRIEYSTIDPSDDHYRLIQRGFSGSPLIGYSSTDGWLVLNIINKEITEISNSTVADLETRYKVFNKINTEVEALRDAANIKVDTLLFDTIYELWNKKESAEE